MSRIRFVLLMILMASCSYVMHAQEDELMLRLRTGNNATFGGFAALSLETEQTLEDNFQISGGVQYNTVGRTAFEARPAYSIDYSWGSISAEALLSYRHLFSLAAYKAFPLSQFVQHLIRSEIAKINVIFCLIHIFCKTIIAISTKILFF
jgi:hypothetical protein